MSDIDARIRQAVRDIPDFPKPGIMFKDITPLLADPALFRDTIRQFAANLEGQKIDVVVGMEARGFLFGAPLAMDLSAAFVPARKPGKLPYKTHSVSYDLEYGSATLEIHQDAIKPGDRVLIADDLLATGGTAKATIELVEKMGGIVHACCFVVELAFLNGRAKLGDTPIQSLVTY
jgi:adenine phosphoribosyltransferase